MSAYSILLRFSSKQSKFRVVAIIISVVLATLILVTVTSFGQGWLQRQQKTDFLSALLANTRETVANQKADQDSIYLSAYDTNFQASSIREIGIHAGNHVDELPSGLNNVPTENELWVTPALKQLIDTNQSLRERYQDFTIKDTFPETLAPSPDTLMLLFHIPNTTLENPRAQLQVTSVDTINRIYNEQKAKDDSQTQLSYMALMVVGVILATPILILITEVARIGMTQREKRYAVLNLVGATIKQVRIMIVLEALPLSLTSVIIGLLLFLWVGVPTLSSIPLGENTLWRSDLSLSGPVYGIIGSLVIVCVLLANLQAVRQVKLSPLTASRRNGVKEYPSILTTIPLLLGISSLYALATYGKAWYADNMGTGGFLVAALLLLIIFGIFFCGPYIAYLLSFVIARMARRAEGILAAHRLRSVSRNTFHSISGVVIALLVGTLLVTLMATIQHSSETQIKTSTSDIISTNQLRQPLQVDIVESSMEDIDDTLVHELESNGALKSLSAQMYAQQTFQEHGGADNPLQGSYYSSCQQLQQRTRLECPNNTVGPYVTTNQITVDDSGKTHFWQKAIPIGDTKGDIFASSFVIVAKDQTAYSRLIELTENIASTYQRQTGTIVDVEYNRSNKATAITYISNISGLIMAMLTVVILTGGLSILTSVISSVYERKKTFSQLRILGTNLAALTRSLTIEVTVPLVALSIVAVGLGIFCSYSLLSVIDAFRSGLIFSLPGISFWASLFGANLLCASLSLVAVPILAQLTKEEVRIE